MVRFSGKIWQVHHLLFGKWCGVSPGIGRHCIIYRRIMGTMGHGEVLNTPVRVQAHSPIQQNTRSFWFLVSNVWHQKSQQKDKEDRQEDKGHSVWATRTITGGEVQPGPARKHLSVVPTNVTFVSFCFWSKQFILSKICNCLRWRQFYRQNLGGKYFHLALEQIRRDCRGAVSASWGWQGEVQIHA